MNKFIILGLLVATIVAQNQSITPCTCTQLLSEQDCKTSTAGCTWSDKGCAVSSGTTTTPTVTTFARYCDTFSQTDCPKTKGCAWVNSKCTYFTGCTPFAKTTDDDCSAIADRCITDGTHCVEVNVCTDFKKLLPCKKANNKYCYWDTTTVTTGVCIEATTCAQLPESLTTDALCREQIKTCTTNGAGCIVSGILCSDQTTKLSCVTSSDQLTHCYWNDTSSKCLDLKCDNAPSSFLTDDQCKAFMTDKSCTTKSGGGCVTKGSCGDATIEAACKTDKSGNTCFWNGTTCLTKNCTNAPSNLTTNQACAEYGNCVSTGAGCADNTSCSVAKSSATCVSSQGNTCFFNTTTSKCLEKKCLNASTETKTHPLCSQFLLTCTVNSSGSGCVDRTCENAPTDLTQTSDCETYLPKKNCITKSGGGCITNTTCDKITATLACTKNSSGGDCFWDTTGSGACKDKTCANAPSNLIDDTGCSGFLASCTVASSGAGCVSRTCENLATSTLCVKDLNNAPCSYKPQCYMKQCILAPSTYTSFTECNGYLSSCTVSDTGSGCIPIPLVCSAIKKKAGCSIKKVVNATTGAVTYPANSCGWNGTQCIDYGCTTIDPTNTTTAQCETAYPDHKCVSANPTGNPATAAGCMDLPTTCAARKSLNNCEVAVDGFPICIWNPVTSACVEKSCATASVAGSTGVLTSFTLATCQGYLDLDDDTATKECLLGNDSVSCQALVANCQTITVIASCIDGAKTGGGNCYYNATLGKCVEPTCVNIDQTTHNGCYNAASNKACTVNNSVPATGCIALTACTSYTVIDQCIVNAQGKACVWDYINKKCINSTCALAPSTASFQDDAACKDFLALSETCTVVYKVGNQGCVAKQASCTGYTDSAQCVTDSTGAKCLWHNHYCWTQSTFLCTSIVLGTYSNANCEGVVYFCKANSTTACQAKVCSDYTTQNGLTGGTAISSDDHCLKLSTSCALNGTACQIRKATCGEYGNTSTACTVSTGGACLFNTGTTTCVLKTAPCTSFTGGDDATCKGYNAICKLGSGTAAATLPCATRACADITGTAGTVTVKVCTALTATCLPNADGSACVTATQSTCEGYGTTQANCLYTTGGVKCFWNSSPAGCQTIVAATCGSITGTAPTITRDICLLYSTQCIENRAKSACLAFPDACSGTTLANCVEAKTAKCIQTAADATGACADITSSTTCAQLKLADATTYTNDICKGLKSSCTNNSTTGCQDKTCANAPENTSFAKCNGWLPTCTWDGATGCATLVATCTTQSTSACYQATEGDCTVVGTACVKKTSCDQAPATTSYNDDTKCSKFMSTCTVARLGGCQPRQAACSSYVSQIQCVTSTTATCYWNTSTSLCSDKTCTNLIQAAPYTTHTACYGDANAKLRCTVRASNGAQVNGCSPLGTCSTYTIAAQCIIDLNAKECEWNTNLTTPACQNKSCATAPSASFNSHQGCQTQSDKCTVAATLVGAVYTAGGCMALGACKDYNIADQCVIDSNSKKCGWNGSVCADKSCATAPATTEYASHAQCQAYFDNKCTVVATTAGQGCVALGECSTYTVAQCYVDLNGNPCYYDTVAGACIKRSCENAPATATDTTGCNDYLAGCTIDSVKCKAKICEDFAFTTDPLCAGALANSVCTSNGTNCVLRTACALATSSVACTTGSDGKKCQWIEATKTVDAYCTVMTCSTAPIANDTETKCKAYYPEGGCTTKSGGGCVVKSTCSAATAASACTQDVNKINCFWDSTGNSCRNKVCSDYAGSTHSICQGVDSKLSCTAGPNGMCANYGQCSTVKVAAGCITGTDGPCLWVAEYKNTDGSSGACFQYYSCKSLAWTTNPQCNLISSSCTTNGTNCLGITLCSETNVNGGCVNGYDGACIQSVDALGSSNPAQCKAYTSCQVAYYSTHVQCQNASTKCTTNGTTGCIDLAACSTYTLAGCFKNNVGVVKSSGAITSTGICTFDTTANACRDQNCSDLKGVDHLSCSSQLSTCTSDGTNCIAKAACSSYLQTGCTKLIGVGSDGQCFWDATLATPACRVMACSDITSGTATLVCASGLTGCVSDGVKCIAKAKCDTYTTKTGCNSGGTDGLCVFTQSTATGAVAGTGTCKLMTGCADASNDQTACTTAKDRCSWTSATTATTGSTATAATPSKCATHTCLTNQNTNGACKNFLNWGQTLQQLCTTVGGKCTETDGSNLTASTCYISSTAYAYTWNTSTSKCSVCTTVIAQPNTTNTTNSTNTTNDTTTTSGYMLGFTSILLGYLMF